MNALTEWRRVRAQLPAGIFAEELEPLVSAGEALAAEVVELRGRLREAENPAHAPDPFVLP